MTENKKQIDWDEMAKIGIRCMISELIMRGDTKEEHLQICQTYTEAVWRHIHRMRFDMEKMHELREAADACLRLSTVANFDSCTLESRVVVALAEMYDELRAQNLWDGVPEEMRGLPLCFLGWETVRELYRMIAPFLQRLDDVKLGEEDIRGAYAEYAAANFYAFGFCRAFHFAEVVPGILRYCEEVYKTPSEVLDVFWRQAPNFEALENLITTSGIGNFKKMSTLAKTYTILYGSCNRQIFTQVLTLLC